MRRFILAILVTGLLSGCSMERKLATEFLARPNRGALLVVAPNVVFFSEKAEEGKTPPGYLSRLSDSLVLTLYMNALYEGLTARGLAIFQEADLSSFMMEAGELWVVNLAQLEMEEYFYPHREEEYFGEEKYFFEVDLCQLTFNTWLEINRMNDPAGRGAMYYNSEFTGDGLSGGFTQTFGAGVKYYYSIDTLRMEEVYTFIEGSGHTLAGKIFDHLMNEYISQAMPNPASKTYYFRYHWPGKNLSPDAEGGFLEVE